MPYELIKNTDVHVHVYSLCGTCQSWECRGHVYVHVHIYIYMYDVCTSVFVYYMLHVPGISNFGIILLLLLFSHAFDVEYKCKHKYSIELWERVSTCTMYMYVYMYYLKCDHSVYKCV